MIFIHTEKHALSHLFVLIFLSLTHIEHPPTTPIKHKQKVVPFEAPLCLTNPLRVLSPLLQQKQQQPPQRNEKKPHQPSLCPKHPFILLPSEKLQFTHPDPFSNIRALTWPWGLHAQPRHQDTPSESASAAGHTFPCVAQASEGTRPDPCGHSAPTAFAVRNQILWEKGTTLKKENKGKQDWNYTKNFRENVVTYFLWQWVWMWPYAPRGINWVWTNFNCFYFCCIFIYQ